MSVVPLDAERVEQDDPPARDDEAIAARSLGQAVWRRLRRDRTALVSGIVSALLIAVALAAPLIELGYGVDPQDSFKGDLDRYGMPYGVAGGISGAHWFGIEPGLGRDLFIQMVYGMRTSLGIAFAPRSSPRRSAC
ncbi:hypothetical protein [Dactylosporangium cerinum]